MRNYLDLLLDVLENGYRQGNRTGIDTLSIPGAMLRFDLAKGFPAVTTKKLAFKAVVGELIGFLRGYDSAADFRRLNCRIWDQNANENGQWLSNPNRKGEDDLGRIYGVQWRRWNRSGGGELDQVMTALNDIRNNPTSRRIIINAWRPDEFDQMALPPCHVLYQFIVNTERKELNLCMYQRSADLFLGSAFNIASSALLLSIFARLTGYRPRVLSLFMGDAHIYENHLDQVLEQTRREPRRLPQLKISDRIPVGTTEHFDPTWIDRIEPDDFSLDGYDPHPAIKAPMAV